LGSAGCACSGTGYKAVRPATYLEDTDYDERTNYLR
jgi:hypothetical protein